MIKKLARETSISMTSVDQDLSSGLLPNSRSMNELGVTFLNTKNVGERQAIEKIFVGVLQNPDTDDSIKFIALAFRPNRIKNRDLWDIAWLERQGVIVNANFIARKIVDHHKTTSEFLASLTARIGLISGDSSIREDFRNEMRRFLPSGTIVETALSNDYWLYLQAIIADDLQKLTNGV